MRRPTADSARAVTEFVDHGVSGAKDRRPAVGRDAGGSPHPQGRRRGVVKLDRLARSTRHLVTLVAEFEALKVDLVVLDQAIDTTTPAGRLLFHMLAAIAAFERDLIRDRVLAGLRRARAEGKHLGRPRIHHVDVAQALSLRAQGHSWRATARMLGVHAMAVRRAIGSLSKTPMAAA